MIGLRGRFFAVSLVFSLMAAPVLADRLDSAKIAFIDGDSARAITLLKPLVDKKNPEALTMMADVYYNGIGDTPQDFKLAADYFRKASDAGDLYSTTMLGLCYLRGTGVETDYAKGRALFQKAADKGFAMAQRNLGILYLEGRAVPGDPVVSRGWMQKAADQGDPIAQWHLGTFYIWGKGGEKDPQQAASLFEKSAQQGFPEAQRELGKLYWKGLGIAKDPAEAVFWLGKASVKDDTEALYWLGHAYMNGYGIAKDEDEAIRRWQKAVEISGNPPAATSIGEYYMRGGRYKTSAENKAQALKYLKLGAEGGHKDGQFSYGLLHLVGLIVDKNPKEALQWFTKAAQQGDRMSMIEIARIHAEGLTQQVDYQEAQAWLTLAAENPETLTESQTKIYQQVQKRVGDNISAEGRAGALIKAASLKDSLRPTAP